MKSSIKIEETVWKEKRGSVWKFFCPHCKIERRLPYRAQPGGFRQIFQVALTSAVFTIATSYWWQWKGVVVALPLWILFEVYYRIFVRSLLSCQNCGFDPYLFLRDHKLAKKEIEVYWSKKFEEHGIEGIKKESVVDALRRKYGLPMSDEQPPMAALEVPEATNKEL